MALRRRKWRDAKDWFRPTTVSDVLYQLTPEERGELAGLIKAAQYTAQLASAYLADIIKRESIPDDSIWDGQEQVFKKAVH